MAILIKSAMFNYYFTNKGSLKKLNLNLLNAGI